MPIPEELKRQQPSFADDFFGEDPDLAERMSRLKRQNPRDRATLLQERLNEKETCASCGSTWFEEITFNQFRAGTYSSTPGGSHEPLSPMPMTILRCLCGQPAVPNIGGAIHGGRTPNENLASFEGSLQAALKHRVEYPVTVARQEISSALASVPSALDLAALSEQIAALSAPPVASEAPAAETEPAETVEPAVTPKPGKKK